MAPEQAFLKGVRAPRADHQKDFAAIILIDVSGSMVAKGYSTRKFDHTVDAAIIFSEIHERLRIPYQMMAFSEEVWRLRTFDECAFFNSGCRQRTHVHAEGPQRRLSRDVRAPAQED